MITSVATALALASINNVLAAPTPDVSPLAARGVPASRFVIYSDNWVTGALPAASTLSVSTLCELPKLTQCLIKSCPLSLRATTSSRCPS